MAQYKVLQDIEAEDKFLGPLTLKQFIFGAIAIVCSYLSVLFITKNLWVVAIPFLPVIIVTGFLAFPWGRDQPTETWLLAKIRFYFKPRKRVWNQTGMQELVKITAPKVTPQYLGSDLTQTEVKSRLKALAETIDSRGWAVKNVNVNMYAQPNYGALTVNQGSDRLVDATTLPQVSATADIGVTDDIFESPLADKVDSAIHQRDKRQKTSSKIIMKNAIEEDDTDTKYPEYWFMDQPTQKASVIKNGQRELGSLSVTPAPDPGTIELAGNNDRVVSSLARESKKTHPKLPDDEVIISLH